MVIITPREEWGALPPKSWTPQKLPVNKVVFFPETRTDVCKTKKQCIRRMQKIQRHHMEYRDLPDIKFNFLVGLDGRMYEGTGWHMRAHDTHVSNYEELDHFISICYIGDFDDYFPPNYVRRIAQKKFIQRGIEIGYIDKNYDRYIADSQTGNWNPPWEGVDTVNRFLDWSMRQGFIDLEWHELFHPDGHVLHDMPLPGTFRYRSIKQEMGRGPSS